MTKATDTLSDKNIKKIFKEINSKSNKYTDNDLLTECCEQDDNNESQTWIIYDSSTSFVNFNLQQYGELE